MPAQIFFGAGSLDNLGSAPLPGTKALIVIGGTSVKRLGYLDRVQALLKKQGVESVVFDKVQPNPVVEHVMEAASLARETGWQRIRTAISSSAWAGAAAWIPPRASP